MKKMSFISDLLGSLGQIVVASILWVFCCLPMFTIGPACTALYYSVVKVIRRERGNMLEAYFHAFKLNFWQSMGWNLLLLSYYAVLALLAFLHIRTTGGFVLDNTMGVILAFAVLLVWMLPFLYPVISRFFYKGFALLRFLLYIAIRYFWVTLIALALLISAVVLFLSNSALLLFLPGIYTLILSWMLEPIFKTLSTDDGSLSYQEWYDDTDSVRWTEQVARAFRKKDQ